LADDQAHPLEAPHDPEPLSTLIIALVLAMTSNHPSAEGEKENASAVVLSLRPAQTIGHHDRGFGKHLHNNRGENQTRDDPKHYAVDEFDRLIRPVEKNQSRSERGHSKGGKQIIHGRPNHSKREDKQVVDKSRLEPSESGFKVKEIGKPASGHRQVIQTCNASTPGTNQSNGHHKFGLQHGEKTSCPHNDGKVKKSMQAAQGYRSGLFQRNGDKTSRPHIDGKANQPLQATQRYRSELFQRNGEKTRHPHNDRKTNQPIQATRGYRSELFQRNGEKTSRPRNDRNTNQTTQATQSNQSELFQRDGEKTSRPPNDGTTTQTVQAIQSNRGEQPQRNSGRQRVLLLQNLSPIETEQVCGKCEGENSPIRIFLRRADVQGTFCIERDTLFFEADGHIRRREQDGLKRLFRGHSKLGFLEWLGGAKGWRFEEYGSGQDLFKWSKDFVVVFNSLQDVFKLLAPKNQLYLPNTNRELIWKKQNNLKACVADVRVWLETLPRNRVLNALFTNSNEGPHSPLHWAHHHPQSKRYPLTIVSRESMTELVNGIVHVFCHQLRPTDQVGIYQLGTVWFEAQEKRQAEWKTTHFLEWNKDKMKALLNGEERFVFRVEGTILAHAMHGKNKSQLVEEQSMQSAKQD
jgi:hypothetical protein